MHADDLHGAAGRIGDRLESITERLEDLAAYVDNLDPQLERIATALEHLEALAAGALERTRLEREFGRRHG